jgi:DNA-binding GntR family transcriptional regulator
MNGCWPKQLRVSRTPLREAIKMLAAEGLVELLPNRGAIAVELTETDVLHTFEVMAGLEGQSGELAAQRITDAELREIKAMHFEMLAAWTRRDLSSYYRLNSQIHSAINAAARQPGAGGHLPAGQRPAAGAALSLQPGRSQVEARREGAQKMIEALAARDGAAMRAVLTEHLHHKRDVVVEQLRAGEAALLQSQP